MARTSGSNGARTRQAVQDAAIKLIAQHGFAAVSMRQIAAEVGVQVGTLYLYTPDKQTLLFEIMHGHMEALLTEWHAHHVTLPSDPSSKLRAAVEFHVRYHISRPENVFISYMELRNLTAHNFAQVEQLRAQYEDVFGQIVTAGQKAGVFAMGDVRLTTMALIAMLTGVSTWYRDGGRLGVDDIVDHYATLALRSVGVQAALT